MILSLGSLPSSFSLQTCQVCGSAYQVSVVYNSQIKSTNSVSFNETLDGLPQLSVCDPIQITHQSAETLPADKDIAVGLGVVDSLFRVPIWFTSKVRRVESIGFNSIQFNSIKLDSDTDNSTSSVSRNQSHTPSSPFLWPRTLDGKLQSSKS